VTAPLPNQDGQPHRESADDGPMTYSGTATLEVLDAAAQNYQRFLVGLIAQLGPHTANAGPVSAVDFGAGIGTYAQHARTLGFDVLCVEPNRELQKRLCSMGLLVASGLDTLSDGSQTMIYSFNVLEHIEDDQDVLRGFFRVLAPGGRLLIYVPAFPLLYSALDRQAGHVRRYRRKDLALRAKAAGFEIDKCVYADSLGFPASLVYRALGHRASGTLRSASVRRYDRFLFPVSRWLDNLLQYGFGKNVIMVAHRPETTAVEPATREQ